MNDQEYIFSKDVAFGESHLWLSILKLKEAMEESKMTLPLFIFFWRKSCVVEKWTSKNNLSQIFFGDASLWNWYKKWHIAYVFLNGDLYEKLFMFQLEGFIVKRKEESF